MNETVLLVDDDPTQLHMLDLLLRRKLALNSTPAASGEEAIKALKDDKDCAIKLVIMDLNMPGMGGLEALKIIHRDFPRLPVIILTGSSAVENAVNALKAGAHDYISKPYEGERMALTVKNALKVSLLAREVTRLKNKEDGAFSFTDMIGHDDGLKDVVAVARKAADTDIPVLITGETGTGKEVLARALHGESPRASAPFIAVNCGAIPEQLVESTLFGHEKGAFTGATEQTLGKFREADGGTIFLDEVGELPLDSQVKLLRILQQHEVEPVGAGKAVPVNLRIISATNRNLEDAVKQGLFREDLFFRLNVLTIEIPPLRLRTQDIPALSRHFIDRFCAHSGRLPAPIEPQALQFLKGQKWSGNVRELENTLHRALVLADSATLDLSVFTDRLRLEKMPPASASTQQPLHSASYTVFQSDGMLKPLEQIESELMALALQMTDNNTTQAAKMLGMAKSTFYRKMP